MQWNSVEDKVLAIQIRRGDSCSRDGGRSNRNFYSIVDYVQKADILIKEHHFTKVYISTDSNDEIYQIQKFRPEWVIMFLPIDRSRFLRMDDCEHPKDIEVWCSENPVERIPFVVDSALADLYFISQCQGYVSTLSSSELRHL